jgi:hypothetical protein
MYTGINYEFYYRWMKPSERLLLIFLSGLRPYRRASAQVQPFDWRCVAPANRRARITPAASKASSNINPGCCNPKSCGARWLGQGRAAAFGRLELRCLSGVLLEVLEEGRGCLNRVGDGQICSSCLGFQERDRIGWSGSVRNFVFDPA